VKTSSLKFNILNAKGGLRSEDTGTCLWPRVRCVGNGIHPTWLAGYLSLDIRSLFTIRYTAKQSVHSGAYRSIKDGKLQQVMRLLTASFCIFDGRNVLDVYAEEMTNSDKQFADTTRRR
jgi:hypothetical protein